MGTWKDDWNDFKTAGSLIVKGVAHLVSWAVVIGVVYVVITNWGEIVSAVTEPFRDEVEAVKEAMTDCGELKEKIDNTERCLSVPNCMLTKNELTQYDENKLEWYRYCSK